jgi:predicted RNA-binding protein
MCESNVFLMKDGSKEVVMENVKILRPDDDGIYLENLFGEHLKLKPRVKEMDLVDHRILLVSD